MWDVVLRTGNVVPKGVQDRPPLVGTALVDALPRNLSTYILTLVKLLRRQKWQNCLTEKN